MLGTHCTIPRMHLDSSEWADMEGTAVSCPRFLLGQQRKGRGGVGGAVGVGWWVQVIQEFFIQTGLTEVSSQRLKKDIKQLAG